MIWLALWWLLVVACAVACAAVAVLLIGALATWARIAIDRRRFRRMWRER